MWQRSACVCLCVCLRVSPTHEGQRAGVKVIWSTAEGTSVWDTSCWGTDSHHCRDFPRCSDSIWSRAITALINTHTITPCQSGSGGSPVNILSRSGTSGMLLPWRTLFTLKSCVFFHFPALVFFVWTVHKTDGRETREQPCNSRTHQCRLPSNLDGVCCCWRGEMLLLPTCYLFQTGSICLCICCRIMHPLSVS